MTSSTPARTLDERPSPPAAAIDVAAAEPTFLQARSRLRTRRWQVLLLAALTMLLPLQILLADRARLAGEARWRPLLTSVCGFLHCQLPAWHEPAAFTMLDREVRPLPRPAGLLQVRASFRNDARWAQAWPQLRLSLSDADGRMIGSRAFSPREYLRQPVSAEDTLAPGQTAQIAFLVREPAAGSAAFGFEFR